MQQEDWHEQEQFFCIMSAFSFKGCFVENTFGYHI